MKLETPLNVLLLVTVSLQLGALATRILGRKYSALAMAGANAALALALVLVTFRGERINAAIVVFVALDAAAAVMAAIGLVKRRESGWLFWPVWIWNFLMVWALVYFRFFWRLVF